MSLNKVKKNKVKNWLGLSKHQLSKPHQTANSHISITHVTTNSHTSITKKSPKLLVISIISTNLAMLAGCQSTTGVNSSQTTPIVSANATNVEDIQLFNIDKNQSSSAQRAKDFLLSAINEHLNSEHTSVTQLRYHASPYVGVDDIETNDDSLFKTFLKVREFQRQKYGDGDADDGYETDTEERTPYRSEEDYLADDSIDTYLRYDDEVAGTLPYEGYDVSKEIILTDDYQDNSDNIYYYTSSYDDCLTSYSIDLDELLEVEPNIDINDKRITKLKTTYDECTSTVNKKYKKTIDAAIGYQTQYIDGQHNCSATFHQQINSLLSPQRSNQSINYDEYDSIYQTYAVCYHNNHLKADLEPIYYLDYSSKESLDIKLAQLQCAEQLFDGHQNLDAAGQTFATKPAAHASLYYNKYNDCDYRAQNNLNSDADDALDTELETETIEAAEAENEDILTDDEAEAINVEGEYEVDEYEPEYASGDEKFEHDLANLDFQSFLADYREMKAQEAAGVAGDSNIEDENLADILASSRFPIGGLGGIKGMSALNMLFGLNQNTPQQIDAKNYYAYHPLVIHAVSRYQPNQQMLTSVYSYDFDTPTLKLSLQMPVEFNFKQAKVTLDPAAMMPVMAMMSPENTPTPDEITGKVVTFELPEEMSKIPVGVFQQSFLKAIQQGLDTLNPEYFTDIDLQNDTFAQQVGATRGIKLYLGSKQSGELLGKILKHLSYDLKNYIDKHPNEFANHSELKQKIDNWLVYNQGFQAKDVGSMLQVIEAVAPISFDQFNYFYFDASGHLIAKQNKTDVSSYLSQTNNSIVSQTRFDKAAFNASPYAKQLNELFFDNRQSINGNKWKKSLDAKQALKDEGRYARYSYDLPNFEDKYAQLYDDYANYDDDYDDNEDIDKDANSNDTEQSNTQAIAVSTDTIDIEETTVITPSDESSENIDEYTIPKEQQY
ncbi:hypothetical protein [Psychrobacter sp. I-STPA10]|uniref:hypothetical protein n=1 Tax=Psychrobacter sp. I-STPA10 TaxID=2585769 RepID=UPI001E5103F5|nr:hypothetical protein [Psychrobacter sp. I-STPA10]